MKHTTGDTLKRLLAEADEGGYAIPMFNYTDLWDQLAVIEAAKELHAPVMFASIPKTVNEIGIDVLGAVGRIRMEENELPFVHHLDHSNSVSLCKQAVDAGYPSVMIDASKETLESNIAMTKAVTAYAHAHGVCVEAEIGKIKGRDYEATFDGGDFLVQVEDAVRLVEETGVDTLAVGIGTAHGFYQGKPEINFKRLAEVNEALSLPLVLHGGTGIPREDVRRAIKNGINKVNVGTQIRYTYMSNMARLVQEKGAVTHTIDIVHEARPYIRKVAEDWIRVCMADGKT